MLHLPQIFRRNIITNFNRNKLHSHNNPETNAEFKVAKVLQNRTDFRPPAAQELSIGTSMLTYLNAELNGKQFTANASFLLTFDGLQFKQSHCLFH